jgi:hypothetical protein
MGSYVEGKSKNEILEEMYGTADPHSVVHEQQKMAIMVRCTEDLEKAISKLSNKITFLDWALTGATVVGAIATTLIAYRTFVL